jgi:hypothetical protein
MRWFQPLTYNCRASDAWAISARVGVKKQWTTQGKGCYEGGLIQNPIEAKGGDILGSVIKKRRKKMRKHKHRKLLARTRHQRRKGK